MLRKRVNPASVLAEDALADLRAERVMRAAASADARAGSAILHAQPLAAALPPAEILPPSLPHRAESPGIAPVSGGKKVGRVREKRVRYWCATVFAADAVADPAAWHSRVASGPVTYLVAQREICPTSGRPHLQAFVASPIPVTMSRVKALLFDNTAHLSVTCGTPQQAADYCKKEDTRDPAADSGPFEFGTIPKGMGARLDLEAVKADIDAGASDLDVAQDHFGAFVRYNKSFTAYRALIAPSRRSHTSCIVYWGPPGGGKTRAATEYDDPANVYWLPKPGGSTAWWDGYNGQRTVIIDEFYGWLPRDLLQRICDRTPLRVEVKGGTVVFSSRTVIITSNTPPERWYKRLGLGAMVRRLSDPLGAVLYVPTDAFPAPDFYLRSLPDTVLAHGPGHSHASNYAGSSAAGGLAMACADPACPSASR